MAKYASNFAITNPILDHVALIMEKVGTLSDSASLSQIKERSLLKPAFLPKDPFDPEGYLAEAKHREKGIKDISPLLRKLFLWAKKSQAKMNPLLLCRGLHLYAHRLRSLKERERRAGLSLWESPASPLPEDLWLSPLRKESLKFGGREPERRLNLSGDSGDCGPYIVFLLGCISLSLDEAKKSLRSISKEQTQLEKKLLSLMRSGVSYSSKELMEKLGLKSRVAVKRNYLEPALKRWAHQDDACRARSIRRYSVTLKSKPNPKKNRGCPSVFVASN
jgi:hypothetical protein